MKKILRCMLVVGLVICFGALAIASGESTETDQGSGVAVAEPEEGKLGNYNLEIKECRLAKDFEGKDVVIVKYGFTNNADEPASFTFAFDDGVYQDGVGLNQSFFVDDSANYNGDDQNKEIKKGASLDVEIAYELNDTTTDIEVEVKELISFNDSVIKKTFTIAQ